MMDRTIPAEWLAAAAEARGTASHNPIRVGLTWAVLERLAEFPEAERPAVLREWRAHLGLDRRPAKTAKSEQRQGAPERANDHRQAPMVGL